MRELTKAVQLKGGELPEDFAFSVFMGLVLSPSEPVRPSYSAAQKWMAAKYQGRNRHARMVQRHIKKRLGGAFRCYDESLAAAENVNCGMLDALTPHLRNLNTTTSGRLLGLTDQLPEDTIWALTVIGLHASLVQLASEVELLLLNGFHIRARACLRTMYETAAKVQLMVTNDSIIAARYYVRGVWDAHVRGYLVDPEETALFEAAKKAWGEASLIYEHNWAAPALAGNPKKVTLKNIVDASVLEEFAHIYYEGNSAIHVDPLRLIQGATFGEGQTHLFGMRGDVNIFEIARAAHIALFMLQRVSLPIAYEVCRRCYDPDRALVYSVLDEAANTAMESFVEITAKHYIQKG